MKKILALIVMNVVNLMNVTSRKIFQWRQKVEIKEKITNIVIIVNIPNVTLEL